MEAKARSNLKELKQLQMEKKEQLYDHEKEKLKKMDELFESEIQAWKEQLKPRKKVRYLVASIVLYVLRSFTLQELLGVVLVVSC